jgi:hypothetical protein
MSRALVRVIPKPTAKSKAVDRLIMGLVGFMWGVLLGGFAAYSAPCDGPSQPPASQALHRGASAGPLSPIAHASDHRGSAR